MDTLLALGDLGQNIVTSELLESMGKAPSHLAGKQFWAETQDNYGIAWAGCQPGNSFYCHQPSKTRISCSARIDNRQQLDEQLGIPTESDAHAILESYLRWGEDCCRQLTGAYAFVIWDCPGQSFFAARDPMGTKPLHYVHSDQVIAIASEARQLVAHPEVGSRVSEAGLLMHCLNRYNEDVTLFAQVKGLLAGQQLTWKNNKLQIGTFWQVSHRLLRYRDPQDYVDHLKELFLEVVADHCRTDAPVVGSMLSGGMDSTSVTAAACEHLGNKKLLQPFSYRFERLTDCDESHLVGDIAEKLGLEVDFLPAEQHWLLKEAFQNTAKLENPFQAWTSLDELMFRTLADQGGTILLTGHGGDNLMTGVDERVCLAAKIHRGRLDAFPQLHKLLRSKNKKWLKAYYHYLLASKYPASLRIWARQMLGRTPDRPAWIASDFYNKYHAARQFCQLCPQEFHDIARQNLYEMLFWHSSGIRRAIHYLDRLAAPYNIETRNPFWDIRLVEFIMSLPPEVIAGNGLPKQIMRDAMQDLLPVSVTGGLSKPLLASFWRLGIVKQQNDLRELVDNNPISAVGMLDANTLKKALDDYLQKDNQQPAMFLPAIWTALWARNEISA